MAPQNEQHEKAEFEVEARDEPTREGLIFRPSVDIIETTDELTLLVDIPGAAPEDVEIDFERGVLTLAAPVASRVPEGARVALAEYDVGGFQRSFRIAQSIDAGAISAESRNGVLVVHLPKSASARPRKIPVLAG